MTRAEHHVMGYEHHEALQQKQMALAGPASWPSASVSASWPSSAISSAAAAEAVS